MSNKNVFICLENGKPEDCPICFKQIDDGQLSLTNTCRHRFCYSCLTSWSRDHTYCPYCRQKFEIIIWINHLRYKNDFDCISIETEETYYRKVILEPQRALLIQRLEEESARRLSMIDELRSQLRMREEVQVQIEAELIRLNELHGENNQIFEQVLGEISAKTNDWTMNTFDTHYESNSVTYPGSFGMNELSSNTTTRSVLTVWESEDYEDSEDSEGTENSLNYSVQ